MPHIKVNFVQAFSGIPIDKSTTAEDLIHAILDRSMVQDIEKYAKICCILEVKKDGLAYPLGKDDLCLPFEKQDCLHFRVVCIPTTIEYSNLDPNFLELMNNQVNRLITMGTWPVGEQNMYHIAGARCGVEFGKFDPVKHHTGMFTKTLASLVNESMLTAVKGTVIEDNIIRVWKDFSTDGACDNHQKAVLNFLNECRQLRPYGSATFTATLNMIQGEEFGGEIYICVNDQGILLLNGDDDAEEITFLEHGQFEYTQEGDDLILTAADKSAFELNFFGAHVFVQMLKFIIDAKDTFKQ